MDERRSSERVPVNLTAMYTISEYPYKPVTTSMINISADGVALIVKKEMKKGQKMELNFAVDEKEISLRIEVMRCERIGTTDQFTIGGKVIEGSDEDKGQFERYYCEKIDWSQKEDSENEEDSGTSTSEKE